MKQPSQKLALMSRVALLGGTVALLSGCLPPTERPELAISPPEKYANAKPGGAEVQPAAWWAAFHSPELDKLMTLALADNLDIAVAAAQIEQADAQAGVARAPLFPSLSGSASDERQREIASGKTPTQFKSQIGLGLTASYLVDFWGKNRSTSLSANQTALASRYNQDVVRLSTEVSVATSYFEILASRDQLRVLRSNLSDSKRILDLIKGEYSAGTVTELDVSQQEALVATIEASIPPVNVSIAQNTAALAVLLGKRFGDLGTLDGALGRIAVPAVQPGLPSQLLESRPDLRMAEAQLAATGFSVDAARAALFPQINLTGTTGRQSDAMNALFAPGAWYWTLAAGLTQPIFDGFQLQNQLKSAKATQLESLETYRKSVLSAFSDVEKSLVALDQDNVQFALQSKAVASSRKAFSIAEAQLTGGTVSLISVLQAQQTLFTAENNLSSVRLSRLQSVVDLYEALGAGWTAPQTAS